ncbi:MAG: hypothetical protein QME92_11460 [Bacillota bacterium]|nr:hypothetical protein [Bacillota bacterium]
MLLPIIKKWAPWILVAVLVAAVVFMGTRWYQHDRLLREALEAKDKAEQALKSMASVEEQMKAILENVKRLDEKQAEIDARVRERDKRLEDLERRTKK